MAGGSRVAVVSAFADIDPDRIDPAMEESFAQMRSKPTPPKRPMPKPAK